LEIVFLFIALSIFEALLHDQVLYVGRYHEDVESVLCEALGFEQVGWLLFEVF
jgi:hypothetical protein